MAAVKQNGYALQYASYVLKNDLEVVMAAVLQSGVRLNIAWCASICLTTLQDNLELCWLR